MRHFVHSSPVWVWSVERRALTTSVAKLIVCTKVYGVTSIFI